MDTIQYKRHKSGERVIEQTSSFYTILAVTAGQGFYYIDGPVQRITQGQCYLFQPDVKLETGSDSEGELSYYLLSFGIMSKDQDVQFLDQGELKLEPFERYVGMWKKIYEDRSAKSDKEQFKNQFRFQKLMYEFIEQSFPFDQDKDSRKMVEETLVYLHEHYHEDVTTEQLAAQAHLGAKQYVYLFKIMTGQTPIDYVTKMRMRITFKQLQYDEIWRNLRAVRSNNVQVMDADKWITMICCHCKVSLMKRLICSLPSACKI